MSKYMKAAQQEWTTATIRSIWEMQSATLWNDGHDIATRIYRVPKGLHFDRHRHFVFVQLFIVSGKYRIHEDGVGERVLEAGDIVFVQPGDVHTETALEDTVILSTKQLPDPVDKYNRFEAEERATASSGPAPALNP